MMSLEVILKNVYTFLDILQRALSDNIQSWDKDMIDNAIRWAKYCQQLSHQSEGKPYRMDLDRQIQELGQLPWQLGHLKINLDLMEQAEAAVKQVLLQNVDTPPDLFEYLLGLYDLNSEQGKNNFIQVCQVMNEEKSSFGLIIVLERCLSGRNHTHAQDISVLTHAKLLLDFILQILKKTPQHKMERTVSFMKKKLSEFAVKPGAMVILAVALKSTHPSSGDKVMENSVKTVILHTIMELPVQYKQQFQAAMTSGLDHTKQDTTADVAADVTADVTGT